MKTLIGSSLVLFVISFILPGAPAQTSDAAPPSGLKIILLDPMIRIEDARGIASKIPDEARADYEKTLTAAVQAGPGANVSLLSPAALGDSTKAACDALNSQISRMARADLTDDALQRLKDIAALDEHSAVFVEFLKVTTGPGGSWNPMTGGITSSASSTLAQAALILTKSGEVLWHGEKLVRGKALKPGDGELTKTLTAVYGDFTLKGAK